MEPRTLAVRTAGLNYQIMIGEGLLTELGNAVSEVVPVSKALLISDHNVVKHYGQIVQDALVKEGWTVESFQIKPGEQSKSLSWAKRIYDQALDIGLDRHSLIVALGGGVVGDLAGFVAATFLRGLPLVMVPTSLLAQVDSSIGGKVAVNHPRGKNLIGSIYPPRLVLVDPQTLKTLPRRQLNAGLSEVVKYGIIEDSDFFQSLEITISALLRADQTALATAILRSLQSKARVVEADEYEIDYRRILNFGHTIGHALEAATDYRYYLHGEAVQIGMLAAVNLAVELAVLPQGDAARMISLLEQIPLKKAPVHLTAAQVIDKLRQDKKRQGDHLIFVLPSAPGKAEMHPVSDQHLITAAVEVYLANNR